MREVRPGTRKVKPGVRMYLPRDIVDEYGHKGCIAVLEQWMRDDQPDHPRPLSAGYKGVDWALELTQIQALAAYVRRNSRGKAFTIAWAFGRILKHHRKLGLPAQHTADPFSE